MDAAALVAELRALNAAGGSYDDQRWCCDGLRVRAPSGATGADAVRAIVSALAPGVQHAPLQTAGCQALKVLLLEPANCAVAGAAGITAVMAALHAHSGNADVLGAAFAALSAQLAGQDARLRDMAAAAGGVAVAFTALRRHPLNAVVAVHALHTLGYLTLDDPPNAAEALAAGAVPAALAAMGASSTVVQVQGGACFALRGIASTISVGDWGGAHVEVAAADAITAAVRAHAGDREVQGHGCDLLIQIFQGDRNADAAWVQRGAAALTVVTAMLRTHLQDVELLAVGCQAVARLMVCTRDNQCIAGVGGVIEAVVAAQRTFPAAAGLQQCGCNALANICQLVRANQLAAAAAGALEATVSAMRAHASNALVQASACFALAVLVADVPTSQTRMRELGAVEVLVAAPRACAVSPPEEHAAFMQQWGEALMQLLRDHPVNAHAAVAAGAIEAIVAHLCAPDAAAAAFTWACRLTTCLLGAHDAHEARVITAGALAALEARQAESPNLEIIRQGLIRHLQPAARRHDAAPCAVAGCVRCAEARTRGVMCALAGCGARSRAGAAAKKLLRCGTCRAACYCSAAHQREDWRRHKRECSAPPGDDGAAGASGH